ncbi:hypothetical protein R4769_08495 [Azotobacter beijerinckii]|uniref:hypothetical protein n=1 Tax=Azotobacter beijerinckii TaxID=170623 RepID=UPI0029547380|nr:hypothetical protein [Azotobacter beijerinckii]MDV7211219.1 hypothetical protein [Azotobacter beijerinckii]
MPLVAAGLGHVLQQVGLLERAAPESRGEVVQRAIQLEKLVEAVDMAQRGAVAVLIGVVAGEEVAHDTGYLLLGDDAMDLGDSGLQPLVLAGQLGEGVELYRREKLVDHIAEDGLGIVTVLLEKLHGANLLGMSPRSHGFDKSQAGKSNPGMGWKLSFILE